MCHSSLTTAPSGVPNGSKSHWVGKGPDCRGRMGQDIKNDRRKWRRCRGRRGLATNPAGESVPPPLPGESHSRQWNQPCKAQTLITDRLEAKQLRLCILPKTGRGTKTKAISVYEQASGWARADCARPRSTSPGGWQGKVVGTKASLSGARLSGPAGLWPKNFLSSLCLFSL
jgi:hypothetical protein